MNILEVLQTIGICLGSFFLMVISMSLLKIEDALSPPTQDEMEEEFDPEDVIVFLKGKSREEIREMLHTPLPQQPRRRQSKSRKKTADDQEQGE